MVAFTVKTELVNLAVTVEGEAVTQIELHGRAGRKPRTAFEKRVAKQLAEYARGKRSRFTFAIRPHGTKFQRAVWNRLKQIPFGRTRTYGEIAKAVGNPGAARAVGMANHQNPVPLVIPCHRVVAAGGKLGGYGGGLRLKQRLLALETTASPDH